MARVKLPVTLLVVSASAFVLIYLVEGYFEGRQASAAAVSQPAVSPAPETLVGRISQLFNPVQETPDPEPASFARPEGMEVHHGLCVAAMTGDLEKARTILQAGVSANARDSFGIRAVARATLWGHYDMVKLLLEHGADVNERERLGVTLLMLAANQGDLKLVDLFLEHGAEVDARSEDGQTAYSAAASKGYVKAADRLLAAGAVAPPPQKRETGTPAMEKKSPADASVQRQKKTASERPDAGPHGLEPAGSITMAPPDSVESAQQTPSLDALKWAADISQESVATVEREMIQELMAREQKLQENNRPQTVRLPEPPVKTAPNAAAAEAVPERKKAVNKEEPLKPVSEPASAPEKNPPLFRNMETLRERAMPVPLILSGDYSASVEPRIESPKAEPPVRTPGPRELRAVEEPEEKPAIPAPGAGTPELVRETVTAVASEPVSLPLEEPAEDLMKNEIEQWEKDLDALVQETRALGEGRETAPARKRIERKTLRELAQELNIAVLSGKEERLLSLLDQGAPVNVPAGEQRMTPLMLAVKQGHLHLARLLLEYGANVHARNREGQTALWLALVGGQAEAASLLRSYGARR